MEVIHFKDTKQPCFVCEKQEYSGCYHPKCRCLKPELSTIKNVQITDNTE